MTKPHLRFHTTGPSPSSDLSGTLVHSSELWRIAALRAFVDPRNANGLTGADTPVPHIQPVPQEDDFGLQLRPHLERRGKDVDKQRQKFDHRRSAQLILSVMPVQMVILVRTAPRWPSFDD